MTEVANSDKLFESNQESDVDDDGQDWSDLEVRNTAVSRELLSASFSRCKRRSYTREKKRQIVQFYYENNNIKYKTCKKFGVSKSCLICWLKGQEQIRKGGKGSK